jgi:hypothetical protein
LASGTSYRHLLENRPLYSAQFHCFLLIFLRNLESRCK